MCSRILRRIAWMCLCACCAGGPVVRAALYVDAGAAGTGDGSSWQNAYPGLQDALAAAATAAQPVEIRVAQGLYKPDQGTARTPGDQMATFQLLNGVILRGGYAGAAATNPDARDVALYETILSGDLAGDDDPKGPSRGDNSCHVVTGGGTDQTAVIDGFTITAGYPWASKCEMPARGGSGMLIDAGSPTVRNCRFIGNGPGGAEGAVLVDNGSCPVFTDCTFMNNDIIGLSNQGGSSPVLTNCRFEGYMHCAFESRGGNPVITGCSFVDNGFRAIFTSGGDLALTSCTFERNQRAVSCWGGNLAMTGCTVTGQTRGGVEVLSGDLKLLGGTFTANRGRGSELVHCVGSVTARYCVFRGNTGWITGVVAGNDVELSDCEFTGNSGLWHGALAAMGDRLIATRCLFAGNTGDHGVISAWSTFARFSNCTFVDNRSVYGVFGYGLGRSGIHAELTDCIVWNGPDPFRPALPGMPTRATVRYSDVQGGYPGVGNIDADPCFVAPGHWADPNDPNIVLGPEDMNAVWLGGDYHLKSQAGHWDSASENWVQDEATSPCIDAGDPNLPLGIEPFPNGGWLNLGAYGGSAQASKSYFGEPVCEMQIPGDINGDCKVDAIDQAILQAHWLMEETMFVNVPPTIKLVAPEDGAELRSSPVSIRVEAADADGTVIKVDFSMQYKHGNSTTTTSTSDMNGADGWTAALPWQVLNVPDGATCTIWAKAMDNDGATTTSPRISVVVRVAK
jgi:hypothetical protein